MKIKRHNISLILDVLITVLVLAAWAKMVFQLGDNGTISAGGFKNLKYFTVLSNLLAGTASVLNIIYTLRAKKLNRENPKWVLRLKYAGAAATALTFIVVVTFLGPVYKVEGLYSGANMVFHVIVPILAFIGIVISDGWELTMKDSLTAIIPMMIYGTVYVLNILINGFGEGPYSNDIYGFLYWGWGGGALIFAILILISWGVALLLRLIRSKILNGDRNGR